MIIIQVMKEAFMFFFHQKKARKILILSRYLHLHGINNRSLITEYIFFSVLILSKVKISLAISISNNFLFYNVPVFPQISILD